MPTHRSLRTQLTAMALGATLVTAAIGAASYWAIDRVAGRMGAVQERRVLPIVSLGALAHSIERQRAQVLATLAATNDLMVEALRERARTDSAEMSLRLEQLRGAGVDRAEAAAIEEAMRALERARAEGMAVVLQHLDRGEFIEAEVAAQAHYRARMDEASVAVDRLIQLQVSQAAREHGAAERFASALGIGAAAAAILALAGGLLVTGWMSRALRRTLGADERELARGAAEVARGNLEHRIAVSQRAESSVAANLNRMSEGFAVVVTEVRASADALAGSASGLARAADDLSGRSARQASSVEQTSAALRQLAATVGQNSRRAAAAEALACESAQAARRGGDAMGMVETRMHSIEAASARVAEILSLIDDITFQTNILALNAAVEAARAGQHGRGFAVVAAEVRALSQRSEKAAGEVRALVQASRDEAAAGIATAAEAATTVDRLIALSSQLTELMQEIARGSQEQAGALTEVSRAVELIDADTQGNARLAERSADDARELALRAAGLLEVIARFDLGAARGKTRLARPARPAAGLEMVAEAA